MDLRKLTIIKGNDMTPSIKPEESLLLDEKAISRTGDVILFENRFNFKIAHRLIYKTKNYYFTKGDNCIVFNFPEKKDKIKGVIVGKYKEIKISWLLKIALRLFLIYFLFSKLENKKRSLLLKFVSKYIVPRSLTVYNQDTLKNLSDY